MRRMRVALAVGCSALAVAGCGGEPVGSATSHASPGSSSLLPCAPRVVALDPGHNPVRIGSFDATTGVAQIDYPNGAEDGNVFAVAQQVAATLRGRGYRVVLLKRSPRESVSYRERVSRAEQAGAAIAVSIPLFGGKIEKAIGEQLFELLDAERDETLNWEAGNRQR